MAGYAIGDVEVLNEAGYAEYRSRFDAILALFGGRLLITGGATEAIEGHWIPKRLVVLEFPSPEMAKAWLTSPEYAEIAPIRHEHARMHFITIVDGV